MNRPAQLQPLPLEDRLTPGLAGTPDVTFGTGGQVALPELANFFPVALTGYADGRVLAAGAVSTPTSDPNRPNYDFGVARLTADGKLDPTFGSNGVARVPFDVVDPVTVGASTDPNRGFLPADSPHALAIQPDGRIVVVGSVTIGQTIQNEIREFGAVRLTADGQLDPTFANAGRLVLSFNADPSVLADGNAVAVRPDGKIVLFGTITTLSTTTSATQIMAAARLNPDGSLDSTFDGDGRAGVQLPTLAGYTLAEGNFVSVQADGGLLVAGRQAVAVSGLGKYTVPAYQPVVARLTDGGALDTRFGDGGRILFTPVHASQSIRIKAFGSFPDGRSTVVANAGDYQTGENLVAFRLLPNGAPDPSYGSGYLATSDGETATATVMADGRVVYGTFVGGVGNGNGVRLNRLTVDGRPDPTFTDSTLEVNVPTVGTDSNGNVLVGGLFFPTPTTSTSTSVFYRLVGEATAIPVSGGSAAAGGSQDGALRLLLPTSAAFDVSQPLSVFPNYPGTLRSALADVTGDGTPDLITATGPGVGPHVKVLDGKTGAVVADFDAFESTFTGGLTVAAADFNRDGFADVIVAPDQGGGPVVAVYDGVLLSGGKNTAAEVSRFLGIEDPDFRGGARPAAGDLDGDGTPDLVVAAGFQGGPRVAVYSGAGLHAGTPTHLVGDFFAFEDTLRNGAFVAVGDADGDGKADVAFGGGPGGAPRVRVISGPVLLDQIVRYQRPSLDPRPLPLQYQLDPQLGFRLADPFYPGAYQPVPALADFFAGDASQRGGVHPLLRDVDGDGKADLLAGSGEGEPARVRVYKSATLLAGTTAADQEFDPFGGTAAPFGVFVG